MEITKELLKEIREKAIAICEIRGKKVGSYDYTYISVERESINVVFRNSSYYESDDIYEEWISIEEMNGDINELLEKRRKEEAEAKKAADKYLRERKKEMKEWQEQSDKREYERLKKKYGTKPLE